MEAVGARPLERATVSPEVNSLPTMKKMQRAREWRAVDCSTDSSTTVSTYASDKVHPYVEIGKHLQELRTLVRESCAQDTARASRMSGFSHEFGYTFRPGHEQGDSGAKSRSSATSTGGVRVSSDDHLYSIKIDQNISETRKHLSSTTTPKRPPRYAVITPEESLMEAISREDAHSTAHIHGHERSSERLARSVTEVSVELNKEYSQVKAIERPTAPESSDPVGTPGDRTAAPQSADVDSSPETTVGDTHGSSYWKQIAHDMEHQLEEAEV